MKPAFRRLIARLLSRQVRRVIRRHHLKVVAVAGSVGKTSTKLAIASVLRPKYRPLVDPGNYNSEIGLPLSVFGLRVPHLLINPLAWIWILLRTELQVWFYPYEVLVLELGTDHPGDIATYTRYLQPDIGVITAITPEHMEFFPGGLDQVAEEELTLAAHCKVLVVNADDFPAKYQHKYLSGHPNVIKYSLSHQGDLPATPQLLGHMRHSALAAAAVARVLKVPAPEIHKALGLLRPVPGRMRPLPGFNGSTIIDDTYNSSPDAVVAALDTLAHMPVTGRRIALLGSMNELGDESPRYHQEVGTAAAGVDMLVTIGTLANAHLGPAAVAAGLDPTRYRAADSPYAAADYLALILQPGDVVLAKGSQNGVFAEEAVKFLLADPADRTHLVRQSPSWLKVKRDQFPDFR